ncbi:hypothetical protein HMI54_003906 [Coelomomyces lativittatus]|nr:hypothetical protein HMI54_003906 [Coelomomyces lativittatus]KAJ1509900.1 hypothetical protein HMI55_007215 [Coelomomyces lativittatus]KAJ1512862.1 hypothetical protein HMI56_003419 [Coelomomyces lativittatus]
MVCKKCEQKLTKLATPEVRKANAGNTALVANESIGSSSRLAKSKFSVKKVNPYSRMCLQCKQPVHLKEGKYCQQCAYKKGICAMCGIQILDTQRYKQSSK